MTTARELPSGSHGGPVDPDQNIRRVAAILCTYRGVTQEKLGNEIGVDKASMWRRMKGKLPFKAAEVYRMSQFFGVSVGVFYAGPEALISSHSVTSSPGKPLVEGLITRRSLTPSKEASGHPNGASRPEATSLVRVA